MKVQDYTSPAPYERHLACCRNASCTEGSVIHSRQREFPIMIEHPDSNNSRLWLKFLLSILLVPVVTAPAQAISYVHTSPLTFMWEEADGPVNHYNVYISVDGQPYQLLKTEPMNSCALTGEDGRSYLLRVEAEDGSGNTGPLSEPSDQFVVYLNGSITDTDGDGMPDEWELSYLFNPYSPSDSNQDLDNDGLLNSHEFLAGTMPNNPDTDGDGVGDLVEYEQAGLDPLNPVDNVPVANAGHDNEFAPTMVTLDGSASYDPNGDPLSYFWVQRDGPDVELSAP